MISLMQLDKACQDEQDFLKHFLTGDRSIEVKIVAIEITAGTNLLNKFFRGKK